jgi:hypothetical protein
MRLWVLSYQSINLVEIVSLILAKNSGSTIIDVMLQIIIYFYMHMIEMKGVAQLINHFIN